MTKLWMVAEEHNAEVKGQLIDVIIMHGTHSKTGTCSLPLEHFEKILVTFLPMDSRLVTKDWVSYI